MITYKICDLEGKRFYASRDIKYDENISMRFYVSRDNKYDEYTSIVRFKFTNHKMNFYKINERRFTKRTAISIMRVSLSYVDHND